MRRRPHDPLVEIEVGVQGDTAVSLGYAGRKLRAAIAALREFDTRAPQRRAEREPLLFAAADALWSYVVQRELIGLTDNRSLGDVFGVTPELWRRMGAQPRRS